MDKREIGYQDLMGDVGEAVWLVTFEPNDSGSERVKVVASSEMGAIIKAEEEFGGTAISARLHVSRCPICASTNCRRPNCGER